MMRRPCNSAALKKIVDRIAGVHAVHQQRTAVGGVGFADPAGNIVEASCGRWH